MGKLTLSVDEVVAARAKRYASRRGTSVSRLVEQYLDLVSQPADLSEPVTPILRRLRAEMKGTSADVAAYRRYLERKYR